MSFNLDRIGFDTRLLGVVVAICALLGVACSSSEPTASTEAAVETPTVETAASEPEDAAEEDAAEEDDTESGVEDAEPDDAATEGDGPEEIDPTTLALEAETVDWNDCGQRLQCGTVQVPADYNDDSLGTLSVAVNVLRSAEADERIGYLLVNPGGPGESGVDLVANARVIGFPDELLNAFDVIGFDPRGVGASEPTFACGTGTEQFDLLSGIVEEVDTDEEIALGQQAAQLCTDSMGPVGARLHSEFVARDMDEIRKALGAEQISYLGFSYGSALGGWYASLFPDNVYSMVVDGASNPLADADSLEEEIQLAREAAGPLHEQLSNALASCDTSACPMYNDGDPEGYWYGMVDKFELVSEAKGGNSAAIVLGVVGHLYSEALWPVLHQSVFDLAENDDPAGFVAAIDNAGTVDEASVTQHVNCLDSWALFPEQTLDEILNEDAEIADQVEAAIADDYPLLYAIELPAEPNPCSFYQAIDPPVFAGTFDGGGIPILVIGNTSDPITPFVKSEQYANDVLADGRLVRVEHPQHVVYPANNCVNDYVHAALIDQEFPEDEPTCEPAEATGLGPVELVEFELPNGATAVRPAGWTEVETGIYAQATSPLDPVVMVIIPTGGNAEGAVAGFASQAGLDVDVAGAVEINGIEWTLYRGTDATGEVGVRVATSPGPDGVLVFGQAFLADIDQLEEQVLQPVVEAFTPAS